MRRLLYLTLRMCSYWLRTWRPRMYTPFANAFAYTIKQTPYAFVSKIILCMYLLYGLSLQNIVQTPSRAFSLSPWGLKQQRNWRPCWCTFQKNIFKILLSRYTNMAAMTSVLNLRVYLIYVRLPGDI